jgi:hypothetical protein
MTTTRHFAYAGLTVRVTSQDAGHLDWLEEFLTPAFTVVAGQHADVVVILDVDDRAYDELLQRGPHAAGDHLDCFVLDNSLVRHPRWSGGPTDVVVYDEESRAFHIAAPDGTRVRVLTRSGERGVRMALMRVVRECAMAAAHASNCLVLHAAALTIAGSGVIIAGPKHAGKTSLLTHLLQQADTRYVSNDRVVVDTAAAAPTFRGMPTLVTIREPMLRLFPHLRERLLQRRYNHRYLLHETPPGSGVPFKITPDRPLSLTPAQFSALLCIQPAEGGSVHAVLFPEVAPAAIGIRVRALAQEATTERLTGALFGSGSSDSISQVFGLEAHRVRIERTRAAALCAELAAHIRGFECQMGSGAYDGAFPLDAIVGAGTAPATA